MPNPAYPDSNSAFPNSQQAYGWGPSSEGEGIVRNPYEKTYSEKEAINVGRQGVPDTRDQNEINNLPGRDRTRGI